MFMYDSVLILNFNLWPRQLIIGWCCSCGKINIRLWLPILHTLQTEIKYTRHHRVPWHHTLTLGLYMDPLSGMNFKLLYPYSSITHTQSCINISVAYLTCSSSCSRTLKCTYPSNNRQSAPNLTPYMKIIK